MNLSEKSRGILLPLLVTGVGGVRGIQEGKRRRSSSYILFENMNNTALHLQHLPSWSISSKHLARILPIITSAPLPAKKGV